MKSIFFSDELYTDQWSKHCSVKWRKAQLSALFLWKVIQKMATYFLFQVDNSHRRTQDFLMTDAIVIIGAMTVSGRNPINCIGVMSFSLLCTYEFWRCLYYWIIVHSSLQNGFSFFSSRLEVKCWINIVPMRRMKTIWTI
jgi:hypothetical protein